MERNSFQDEGLLMEVVVGVKLSNAMREKNSKYGRV